MASANINGGGPSPGAGCFREQSKAPTNIDDDFIPLFARVSRSSPDKSMITFAIWTWLALDTIDRMILDY